MHTYKYVYGYHLQKISVLHIKHTTTLDKKKEPSRDSRREECCSIMWYHARDAQSAQGKSRGWTCPALIVRHRAGYHKIEQCSSRRESRGWFFFLSRVVVHVRFGGGGSKEMTRFRFFFFFFSQISVTTDGPLICPVGEMMVPIVESNLLCISGYF